MTAPLVLVVAKRTSWQRHVEETSDPLVAELLRRGDPTVARLRAAHEAHEATVGEVERSLARLGLEARWVENPHDPFSTEGAVLLLTVGGDGTLLTASHQVGALPVLGVNSAPGISVGFFCGGVPGQVEELLSRFLEGGLPRLTLARMQVTLNGRTVSNRVLNDALLCHACPAATSRYILDIGGEVEEQRSSGFWVGPAAGSTAAQRSAGGEVLPLDSQVIQLVVREPYNPHQRPLAMVRRLVEPGQELVVRSKMLDARLFLDGPTVCENVTLGDVLVFRRSNEPLSLLCLSAERHRC